MFGKLKDWRRIDTRYDRCAHTFMSAIYIAATAILWINQQVLGLGKPGRIDTFHLNESEFLIHSSQMDSSGRIIDR